MPPDRTKPLPYRIGFFETVHVLQRVVLYDAQKGKPPLRCWHNALTFHAYLEKKMQAYKDFKKIGIEFYANSLVLSSNIQLEPSFWMRAWANKKLTQYLVLMYNEAVPELAIT